MMKDRTQYNKAVFLDRDGVLIENLPGYIRTLQEVNILPGVIDSMRKLSSTEFKIILITNQSVIGRGMITMEAALEINTFLASKITEGGGRIDHIYMCPHAPDEHCECRKPKPGLIHLAQQDFSLDLSSSIMIGDALTDIQAAQAAGVGRSVLVLTGRGAAQSNLPLAHELADFDRHADLGNALGALLNSRG